MIFKEKAYSMKFYRILFQIISTFLFLTSLFSSVIIDINVNEYHEYARIISDYPLIHFSVIAGFIFFLRWLDMRLKVIKINTKTVLMTLLGTTAVLGILFVTFGSNIPINDSSEVLYAANSFAQKEYSFLLTSDYLHRNPHQFGMIFIYQILTQIGGPYNYYFYRLINIVALCISLLLIYKIMSQYLRCTHFSCILMMLFYMFSFQSIFYSTFIYGTVLSLCFMLSAFFLLFKYEEQRHFRYLYSLFFCLSLALLAKNNALIMIVAIIIYIIYQLFLNRSKMWTLALLITFLSFISPTLVKVSYQNISGISLNDPVPASAYIAMGMQEGPCGNGWFNMYAPNVYWKYGGRYDNVNEAAQNEIKNRANIMFKNPMYGLEFYLKKAITQWSEPTWQSLWQGSVRDSVDKENVLLQQLNYQTPGKVIWHFLNILQSIIWFGLILYGVKLKNSEQMKDYLLPLILIGGFFFQLLWEAKALYIYPYYFLAIPLSAQGYNVIRKKETVTSKEEKK